MKRRLCSLSLLAVVLCVSAHASAQDDFMKKEAQQRFQEGTVLMTDGKYEPARTKFVQAYATMKVPNVVFNLARCEHFTGRYLEATHHYREYLRIVDPKMTTPRERDEIDGWLKETSKYVGRLEISAPAGAHLLVDGERVGDAPLAEPYDVARGKHAVVAETNGKRLTAEIDAPAGATTKVVLVEGPAAPSAVPRASATPGTQREDVVTPPPREPDASSWTGTKTVAVVVWAGAVAAVVTGGFLLKAGGDKADEGRAATAGVPTCVGVSSPACDDGASAARSSSHLTTGGAIALVGAGALAVTGAVLFFWPRGERASGQGTAVTIRGAGLELVQRF